MRKIYVYLSPVQLFNGDSRITSSKYMYYLIINKYYDEDKYFNSYYKYSKQYLARIAQRMGNCKSHSRHIKTTHFIGFENIRVLQEIETDRNGTHLKLKKKHCTRMFSKTIKGFSWIWPAVGCLYNYAFSANCLVKIGQVTRKMFRKNINQSRTKFVCSVPKVTWYSHIVICRSLQNIALMKMNIFGTHLICKC